MLHLALETLWENKIQGSINKRKIGEKLKNFELKHRTKLKEAEIFRTLHEWKALRKCGLSWRFVSSNSYFWFSNFGRICEKNLLKGANSFNTSLNINTLSSRFYGEEIEKFEKNTMDSKNI